MDKKQQINCVLLSGIAISAMLTASLFVTNSQFAQKVLAQGNDMTNAKNRAAAAANASTPATNQNGMSAVLNAVHNTNATSTAAKNIINATSNMTNKTN
jgi:hypothetical protein